MNRNRGRAAAVAAALSLAALAGCDGNLNPLDIKSFLDPSELAGRSRKDTTIKPILEKIDPREEVRADFNAAQPPTQDDLLVTANDYTISKNDLLSVEISDLNGVGSQTVKTTRVSESGNISLPYIGQIKVEGLTEYEVEQKVVEGYRNAKILEKTNVTVVAVERRGAAFDVLGAVARPGQYALVDPDFRVLNALTLVGDASSPLLTDLYILRRTDTNRPSGARPAPAAAPAGGGGSPAAPVLPQTQPGRGADDLRPQSSAGSLYAPRAATAAIAPRAYPLGPVAVSNAEVQQAVLLQADGAGAPVIPGETGRDAVGEYRMVDGRKIYISTNPVPPAGGTPAAPSAVSDIAPPPATPAAPPVVATPAPAPAPAGVEPTPAAPPTGGTGAGRFPGFKDLAAPDNIRVIHIPLDKLRSGELQYNVVIKPKDMLIVQNLPLGVYYMGGHVGQPGAFSLAQSRVTLKQAVVSARMLDTLAIPERTDLVRRLPNNQEIFIRVDLARIFEGKDPDVYLRPDDQVYVGTNFLAPFLAALRSAFRFTYGFGFLYDRNFAAEENNRSSGN